MTLDIRPLDLAERLPEFSCGDSDLDNFLRDDAARLQEQGAVKVYLAFSGSDLVGYVALLADSIKVDARERKGLNLKHDDHPVVPGIKVGRLATSKDNQGMGIGTALINFAVIKALSVSEHVGCRLLTLDAYPDRVSWYEKRRFVRNKRATKDATDAWRCPADCPESQPEDAEHPVSMRRDLMSPG